MIARLALIGLLAALVVPAAGAAAPTISGSDGDLWNAGLADPDLHDRRRTRGRRMEWRLDGGRWVRERAAVVVLAFKPISDGQHVLRVRDDRRGSRDDDDDDDDDREALRRFRVGHRAASDRDPRAPARGRLRSGPGRRRALLVLGRSELRRPRRRRPAPADRRPRGRRASPCGRLTTPGNAATAQR